ncbi:unnamed protein product [Arctogadus glacialis]
MRKGQVMQRTTMTSIKKRLQRQEYKKARHRRSQLTQKHTLSTITTRVNVVTNYIFPSQYAWYLAKEAPFDFTVKDMPVLRKWWCTVLLENFHLDGHGRRFPHFMEEAKQMV